MLRAARPHARFYGIQKSSSFRDPPHLLMAGKTPPLTFASPPYPRSHPYLIMDIELLPTVSLAPETNSLLIAPVELLADALRQTYLSKGDSSIPRKASAFSPYSTGA